MPSIRAEWGEYPDVACPGECPAGAPWQLASEWIEAELNLTAQQLHLWHAFEDTYDEIDNALEAVDAIVDMQVRDRAPMFIESLQIETRYLSMQLGARKRMAVAAANFLASLTPKQQVVAERHMHALSRQIGFATRWSKGV